MDKFEIVITKSAELAYFDILEYVYDNHSLESANQIAVSLLDSPNILSNKPFLGTIELMLSSRKETYRYLLFQRTNQATIKIIYFVDENNRKIYVTDFFPTEMNPKSMSKRT